MLMPVETERARTVIRRNRRRRRRDVARKLCADLERLIASEMATADEISAKHKELDAAISDLLASL